MKKYYSDLDEFWESESEKAAEKMGGKGWHTGGEILSSAVSAVPGMVMGGMLSGINTTGALGSSTIGAASAVGQSNFWREFGDDTISEIKQIVKIRNLVYHLLRILEQITKMPYQRELNLQKRRCQLQ